MKTSFFGLLFVGLLAAIPATSHAYKTTDQTAFTLDERTGIYLVEFKLGHQKHDVYVPITATTGNMGDTTLTYTLYDTDNMSIDGATTGMVISDARIDDGMYKVPAGTKKTFTLFTTFTPEKIETDGQYRLEVTSLPFSFDGTQQLGLNPSELQYYTTDYLKLSE